MQLTSTHSFRDLAARLYERSCAQFAPLQRIWRKQSLSKQFAIVAATVILLGMTAIGTWVAKRIEEGVTHHSAAAAALYVDALIAPLAQEFGKSGTLSEESLHKLDDIMSIPEFKENIASFKIWLKGGVIGYSNFKELIGQKFEPTPDLRKAWQGVVSAQAEGLGHDDEHRERELGVPLMEIYAPIRETSTNRIIAVSEFYMRADKIRSSVDAARAQSWGVVGSTALLMTMALYMIVRSGSKTIEEQQASLRLRAQQNEELGKRIERAYWRADRLNEQFLRRVGADLHDGPAQLLGLALLRLDDLPIDHNAAAADPSDRVLDVVRGALDDAIREIRNMSRGLMLPELDDISVNDMVAQIVQTHEERTGSKVELDLPAEQFEARKEYKVCLYRFLQEALSNSHRHAPGSAQHVAFVAKGPLMMMTVSDNGPGLKAVNGNNSVTHLGLVGIRDRVETLNGSFVIYSPATGGTTLQVTLDTSRPLDIEV